MKAIGITGRNCAGKDATADLLEQELGFERWSLSDVLREELRRRGEPITREALIAVGVELRTTGGPAVLAEKVKDLIATDRVCLVSVRSPAEVEALRRLDGFRLWALVAPAALRYERELARQHERGEQVPPSLEAFLALEELENSESENAQQLDAAIALADVTITNDGTLDDLREKVLTSLDAFRVRERSDGRE